MRLALLAVTTLSTTLFGCRDNGVQAQQVRDLTTRLDSLSAKVEKLQLDVELNEMLAKVEDIAYLTPGSEGYTTVSSDLGKLTVSLED